MAENIIPTVSELRLEEAFSNGVLTARRFIGREYLASLSGAPVVPLSEDEIRRGSLRLMKIARLVYDKKENVNDKLISVYSALQNVDSGAALLLKGNKEGVEYYLGINSERNASVAMRILEKSLLGNFPGSETKQLTNSEIDALLDQVTRQRFGHEKFLSSVTVVPSMRDKDKEKFVQGMEKFVDTMQGENYCVMILARPVSQERQKLCKKGLEDLYSTLSPFMKTTLAYGVNSSTAVSKGMFTNFSRSITSSVSNTQGTSHGTSLSHTRGKNAGISGGGFNVGGSVSDTRGTSDSASWSRAVTSGTADTTGTGENSSKSVTEGDSRTLTIERQDKTVGVLLEKIEGQLKRIKACESYGVWECASYFIADDIQTSVVAANAYKALMLGEQTDVENACVNVWGIGAGQKIAEIFKYLRQGEHPLIRVNSPAGYEAQEVTPANFISGRELPLLFSLPHKSVAGLTVTNIAEFGRNVFVQNQCGKKREIRIGRVQHMGRVEEEAVNLDLDSLTSHCFICGSTGSGKSNTTYGLLERFIENKIPFLVIEPAKGEYRTAFGGLEQIHIFTTNPGIGQMLKINPFRFDPGIHILEHLDRLIEIFNACWEMYAAMPAILKDAVEQIYIRKGWDLLHSQYMRPGEPVYPTFADLMTVLPSIIQSSGYSSDTQGDYTGALVTRVKSLTNGISGEIFCDIYDIPDTVLFDENTIVDVSRVGSSETKSLIMGILVLKLTEYRTANARGANSGLRHITVMEEAHNLLKKAEPSSAGSSVVQKSVEMITSSIAEMRTYGEGFIIVDQSPTSVDIAAIKNTNTKIIMRLPEQKDCEAVARAVSLSEDQTKEIAKLGMGVAVVMQNNWLEAVLTKIDKASDQYEKEMLLTEEERGRRAEKERLMRGAVIDELLRQYRIDKRMDPEGLRAVIEGSGADAFKKREMLWAVEGILRRLEDNMENYEQMGQFLLSVSGCQGMFDMLGLLLRDYKEEDVKQWEEAASALIPRYAAVSQGSIRPLLLYMTYYLSSVKNDSGINYDSIYENL